MRASLLWIGAFSVALSGCVVSRAEHARALRELELAQGRLVDAQEARADESTQAAARAAALEESRASLQSERDALDHERTLLSQEVAARREDAEGARAELARERHASEQHLAALGVLPGRARYEAHYARDLLASSLFSALSPAPALSPQGRTLLSEYAAEVLARKETRQLGCFVLITAYSDGTSDDLHSASLLAESVARALRKAGLAEDRVRVLSAGHASPRCTQDKSPACVAQNQRVTLSVLVLDE
jgi:outer membrane protein OmpA-like peptidoglycan-associated protein